MKRIIGTVLLCTLTICAVTSCAPVVEVYESQPTETTEELPVRPQDDFYRYINGEALKNVSFEYGDGSAGAAFDRDVIDEQIETVIRDTVAGSGYANGSEEDIIKKAYEAYLEYDFNNEPVPEELIKVLEDIDNCSSIDEFMKLDAMLQREYNIVNVLYVSPQNDPYKTDKRIIMFGQYTNILTVDFETMREDRFSLDDIAYDGEEAMKYMGYDKETAHEYGVKLAVFGNTLYGSTDLEIMDANWQYEYMQVLSADEIENIFTDINVSEYLKEIGFDLNYCREFCVGDMEQLTCLGKLISEENLDALKTWKIAMVITKYMRFFAPHHKEFAAYVEDSYLSPEEQAINEITAQFYMETDPIYVERYYSQEMDDALISMCDDIREGYRNLISNASWLTEATRKGLVEKLDNIVYVTGSVIKRHDNSKYAGISGNYYEIVLQYSRIEIAKQIASLGEPVDRKSIDMPMQEINACYDPLDNNINITVAITNAPFFDVNADYYTNLGGLGSVIAHEMGHAFDSDCIVFDKDGNYNPKWIADEDMEAFVERNKKAAAYFEDNYVVFGVYHVDGERTLGENYADLSGMECITSLAKTDEDLKKIFENYAVIWRIKRIDNSIISLIAYDTHSPEVIRTNGVLSTLDCFYEVYDVKEGDGMYIAPENRISRWY